MERYMERFEVFLSENGLRHSEPREAVVREFFRASEHISVEELLRRVKRNAPAVGIATVYRTLNLLVQSGLAVRRDFSDGRRSAFERRAEAHHDHLICTRCGEIVEFSDRSIESLQEQVAQSHDFALSHHKMELYGLCRNCRKQRGKSALRAP